MVASWAVVLSALVYLCLLFAVAHWGDNGGRRFVQGPARSTIAALSLAVYCTSWTFFGSVGLASRSGFDFLTIYIGPILVIGLGIRWSPGSCGWRRPRTSPPSPISWRPATARANGSPPSSA